MLPYKVIQSLNVLDSDEIQRKCPKFIYYNEVIRIRKKNCLCKEPCFTEFNDDMGSKVGCNCNPHCKWHLGKKGSTVNKNITAYILNRQCNIKKDQKKISMLESTVYPLMSHKYSLSTTHERKMFLKHDLHMGVYDNLNGVDFLPVDSNCYIVVCQCFVGREDSCVHKYMIPYFIMRTCFETEELMHYIRERENMILENPLISHKTIYLYNVCPFVCESYAETGYRSTCNKMKIILHHQPLILIDSENCGMSKVSKFYNEKVSPKMMRTIKPSRAKAIYAIKNKNGEKCDKSENCGEQTKKEKEERERKVRAAKERFEAQDEDEYFYKYVAKTCLWDEEVSSDTETMRTLNNLYNSALTTQNGGN